jgi:hypothetical protein
MLLPADDTRNGGHREQAILLFFFLNSSIHSSRRYHLASFIRLLVKKLTVDVQEFATNGSEFAEQILIPQPRLTKHPTTPDVTLQILAEKRQHCLENLAVGSNELPVEHFLGWNGLKTQPPPTINTDRPTGDEIRNYQDRPAGHSSQAS